LCRSSRRDDAAVLIGQQLASPRFGAVGVLVTQPLNVALRGLATVPHAALDERPPASGEEIGVIVFDRERHANGREAAFLRPEPAALATLAAQLHRRGVRHLVVVTPHAPATLPDALKRGLATLDEQAVAALGFAHLLIVRPAHASPRERAAHAAQRLADWVLSQLHLMIPQRDKPVRAGKVARLVAHLAARLPDAPGGTRVLPPEAVWDAAQAPDVEDYARDWLLNGAATSPSGLPPAPAAAPPSSAAGSRSPSRPARR
jgi:hypothetical protein